MPLEPVRQGDIIDVIAPASRCSNEELKNAVRRLLELGLVPRVPKDLFGKTLLFSNTDEIRLKHLKNALYADDSSLVWCVRGGYGALRLMDQVRKWKRPAHAKIFLGYSDITTLHTFLNQEWGWPTLHGPLLDRLGRGAMSRAEYDQLFGILAGEGNEVLFHLKPLNRRALARKTLRGPVMGGNFTVLASGLATPTALRPGRHILFLEDTGERPHRVDRMLTQFAQSGMFDKIQALVLGHFQLNDVKDRRGLWNDVFARFADQAKFPVLAGLPVGHDVKKQFTLPLGSSAELRLGGEPVLRVNSGILAI